VLSRLRPLRVASLVAVAGTALASLALAPSPAGAQGRQRAMYVNVLDKDGKPVPDVKPEDLSVREDGAVREVLTVAPATEPLQITLLIDNSAAASRIVSQLRDALKQFVTKVATGDHEISIVTLGDRPTLVVDVTTDPHKLIKNGVERLFSQPGSGMYLLDALLDTTKGIRKRESTHPVIVSVTTEGVEFSNDHYERVLEALRDSGAMYYALVLTDGPDPDQRREETRNRNIVFDRGTNETGGSREILLSEMSLEPALTKLANELLHQYKVTYGRPETMIPPRKVTVEAKAANLTARGVVVPERRSNPSR